MTPMMTESQEEEQTLIIEVTENPHKVKEKIENTIPSIEIVYVFDELIQAVAIRGKRKNLQKLQDLTGFVQYYPVQTYRTQTPSFTDYSYKFLKHDDHRRSSLQKTIVLPEVVNETNYTGKGVKIGVIDTGVDYHHPDLNKNYQSGYDLVDLDEDPQETTIEQGAPTSHGTHVAGIIGANGNIKGVAPDASLYAYRALGPGGIGTSVHVIAAMEKAIKDGVDILNLSLGNSVNGPDYPTSKAVTEASNRGVAVIVANGNDGPDNWTIGAPATAQAAFSVGAYAPFMKEVYLTNAFIEKDIQITELPFAAPWDLERDHQLIEMSKGNTKSIKDKIVLIEEGEENLLDYIKEADKEDAAAVLIIEQGVEKIAQLGEEVIDLPIALVNKKEGEGLQQNAMNQYIDTIVRWEENVLAPFSSRGPVAADWTIKPNILAPGVNVLSTVPNGYEILSGTSMATPHITGMVALLKEAKPSWTKEQIFAALETTADKITDQEHRLLAPHLQGMGVANVKKALDVDVLIEKGLLSFGKTSKSIERTEEEVTLYNVSNEEKKISFSVQGQKPGLRWELPKTFILKEKEEKTVKLKVKIEPSFLQSGIQEGFLTVNIDDQSVQLPYLFINETDSYNRIAQFTIEANPFDAKTFKYELYVTEAMKSMEIRLYDPDTLHYEQTLLSLSDLSPGKYEGELERRVLTRHGLFHGLFIYEQKDGKIMNEDSLLYLPEG